MVVIDPTPTLKRETTLQQEKRSTDFLETFVIRQFSRQAWKVKERHEEPATWEIWLSFWCKSTFSRFLCLSWWPAGLTSCLPTLPQSEVGERGKVCVWVKEWVSSGGGVFLFRRWINRSKGAVVPTLEEGIRKLSSTDPRSSGAPLGAPAVRSSIHKSGLTCSVTGEKSS